MDRREFLKLGGVLSAVLFLQTNPVGKMVALPSFVEVNGKMYRGTPDGKIYSSTDHGRRWNLMVNFGSDYSVTHLSTNRSGQLYAGLQYAGREFNINLLDDGKTWWAY